VDIRHATPADYADCLSLDATVTTNMVWQMEESSSADGVVVEFHLARLPRLLTVGVSREAVDPLQRLASSDLVLVATDAVVASSAGVAANATNSRVQAYLRASQRHGLAWLDEIIVEPASRRKGLAASLVQGARGWARERGLRAVLAEAPARHLPAIALLQKCGFAFCGFHDHMYDGRDIVVLFSLKV
jgi:GNAT superfamily N-acetyltransferase